MLKQIKVKTQCSSYSIYTGSGILHEIQAWANAKHNKVSRFFIIADQKLFKTARLLTHDLKKAGFLCSTVFVEATEELKEITQVYPLYDKLIKAKADRRSCVIALGGGVVGDVVGFVAGTYLRGIRWVGIPTTLLAQVDSSIGGKTGINHETGKNLIGVFHQPSLVLLDRDLLKTLPYRERVSGLGEIIKYALAFDPPFFVYLQKHWRAVLDLDSSTLSYCITKCAQWKARVVSEDPYETKGLREFLNLGHTLGHALEAATQYQVFRHGEAVLLGCRAAALLSLRKGILSDKSYQAIDSFLREVPVPAIPKTLSVKKILSFVKRDKKTREGQLRFVLLLGIGKCAANTEITSHDIDTVIQSLRGKPKDSMSLRMR